ncbi:MAG: hypothetical protein RL660_448 [Bacteroidota bacterium]|jgi:hypothetical protein
MKQLLLLTVPGIWIGLFASFFAANRCIAMASSITPAGRYCRTHIITRNRKWRRRGTEQIMKQLLAPRGVNLVVQKGHTRQKTPQVSK